MGNLISRKSLLFVLIVTVGLFVGTAQGEWQPIKIDTFSEDAGDEWIAPPNGSSGAPRQGWLGTVDGFFTQEWHVAYAWLGEKPTDAHAGIFRFNMPLTKRFWMGWEVPFLVNIGNKSEFGDATVTFKAMLHEEQDLSINAGVGLRIPTGNNVTGNDRAGVTPQINIWSDIGGGWSLRGGVSVDFFPESNSPAPRSALKANLAIGHTITPHEDAPLGDFTYYAALNFVQQLGGDANDTGFLSVFPGIRTHLGDALFFLTGLEIPVSNPNGFDQQLVVQIVKGF